MSYVKAIKEFPGLKCLSRVPLWRGKEEKLHCDGRILLIFIYRMGYAILDVLMMVLVSSLEEGEEKKEFTVLFKYIDPH